MEANSNFHGFCPYLTLQLYSIYQQIFQNIWSGVWGFSVIAYIIRHSLLIELNARDKKDRYLIFMFVI
jgi:hypothetical protein